MEHFNKVGINSSNVYYVNHDKNIQKQAYLKGGALQQAQLLKQKHYEQLSEKHQRMKQEAEERARVNQKLQDEDMLAKEMKNQKKKDLFKVIEKDKDLKKEHRNQDSKLEKRGDFGDHNVLSYIYEKKEH